MTLLLISKTAIIKQIFNLVSTKLNIELTTLDICVVNKNYDLIIVEDICSDDSFPTSNYAKQFGIITKDAHNNKNDFLISKPFLPSTLLSTLETQIKLLQTPATINEGDIIKEDSEENEITDSLEFIETLADDICDEINEESDESVVTGAFIENGGILDKKELSNISTILDFDTQSDIKDEVANKSLIENESNNTDDDWIDLANIIDKAIDEVKEYKFESDEPIKLMLNEYSMNEISPLLNRLGQNIVDELTNGKEITIKLKVEN